MPEVTLEVTLEEHVFAATTEAVLPAGRAGNRRDPIPKPTDFAVNLKAYVDTVDTLKLKRKEERKKLIS
jgi:hypothetical protein